MGARRPPRAAHAVALALLALLLTAAGAPPATAEPFPVIYFDIEPLAVRVGSEGTVNLSFQLSGDYSRVELVLTDGTTLDLSPAGDGLFTASLAHAQVLRGYRSSEPYNDHNHNHFGYLDVYRDDARLMRGNLFVLVADERVPEVAVETLAPDAQKSPHLVNILAPDMHAPSPDPATATQRFYQLFPDDYDFINVLYLPQRFANRTHATVRSEVEGIGMEMLDAGARYGSAERLLGIINYPLASYFDLASSAAVHEIGHQWINHLDKPEILADPGGHWPLSSLAQSVMGRSGSPETGYQGISFPYAFGKLESGDYRLGRVEPYGTFTDVDLYLMGLMPPEEVGTHFVFDNQAQEARPGGTLAGPVTEVTVEDIVRANGPRRPAYPEAPRSFRAATVVLSKSRLLSPTEMAVLDYFAARGSLAEPVPFSSGFSYGTAHPFRAATKGRGCLSTALDEDECARVAAAPTAVPTDVPTVAPTVRPSPTVAPAAPSSPTVAPSAAPTVTRASPSAVPTPPAPAGGEESGPGWLRRLLDFLRRLFSWVR